MEDFEKSLNEIVESNKNKIKKLEKNKHNLSINELEHQLSCYNDSINIMTYSLLQRGMTKNEKIKKKNK